MIADFLIPIQQDVHVELNKLHKHCIGNSIVINSELLGFPKLDDISIAFIGVEESRASKNNKGTAKAPQFVRNELYKLQQGNWKFKIADLGNLKINRSNEKTSYKNATQVFYYLLQQKIIPIIIGGTHALTYAMYRAYDEFKKNITLAVVDSQFDLGRAQSHIHFNNYLSHIIMRKPNNLFNYKNLGFQTYFVNQEEINLLDKMHFDIHRLGEFSEDITIAEPILRDVDLLSIDVSSIRGSDARANENASPNGFYGEQSCALAKYAGTSSALSSFGIFEYNPLYDERGISAKLLAQIVWYFIEGYANRIVENPNKKDKNFTKYTVPIQDQGIELHFIKSNITTKWWLRLKIDSHYRCVPCSYKDYMVACDSEIPEIWYKIQRRYH